MPQQVLTSVENNFTKGLITEATGLNFPENAATSASNCEFTLIGDVTRRYGINIEENGTTSTINRAGLAMSSYVWNNPGGDGNSKLLVKQVGQTLYFYNIATATAASPLSTQLLSSTVTLAVGSGTTFDPTVECTYAAGNGYLFVYHPSCDTNYVTYNSVAQTFTSNTINIQIRDFTGLLDNLPVSTRPSTLSAEHQYNLTNQGWTASAPWSSQILSGYAQAGPLSVGQIVSFTISSGIAAITTGTSVHISYYPNPGSGLQSQTAGIINAYNSGTGVMTITVTGYFSNFPSGGGFQTPASIGPTSIGYISTFFADLANYPSNSDVWWYFKDATGVFNPTTTAANVTVSTGQAPQGHYTMPAFTLDRNLVSGQTGLTVVSTPKRPTNGCWFQGRVWYTGVSAAQQATGDADFYTWTENVYFSQIVSAPADFSSCFQNNDPTSETLSALLPTDGGVINVVGSGTIHKLFPIQNGLLVFANNGVWFITGSQGIGFTADDYTITKISSVKILSNKSFVDVLGLPFFWNEDGIYQVQAQQNGSLAVEPISVGTILTFYNSIPLASKKYARGDYDPINYVVQWSYRSTPESSVTDRYQMDTILNFNTYNKAFFPYTVSSGTSSQYIHGINYVSYPYISTQTPDPSFEYPCSELIAGVYKHSLAQEYDDSYVDWGMANYDSTFMTGYKLRGQGLKYSQVPYVSVYSRNNGYAAYNIQGVWDYSINSDSNRWSMPQFIELNETNTGVNIRRHKIRGRGRVYQIQVTSVDEQPFDIMGWAIYELANTGM